MIIYRNILTIKFNDSESLWNFFDTFNKNKGPKTSIGNNSSNTHMCDIVGEIQAFQDNTVVIWFLTKNVKFNLENAIGGYRNFTREILNVDLIYYSESANTIGETLSLVENGKVAHYKWRVLCYTADNVNDIRIRINNKFTFPEKIKKCLSKEIALSFLAKGPNNEYFKELERKYCGMK